MKRRTAAWSSNNTLTVAERAATLAGSGAEAKRTYNSGGGGGSVSGNGRNNAHYLKGRNRGSAGRKKARKA